MTMIEGPGVGADETRSRSVRPTRDETGLALARIWAERGTCARRQVGCVLFDADGYQLASGYNGPEAGAPHCIDEPCPGVAYRSGAGLDECVAIHAEQNALMSCADVRLIHTCYVTVSPCVACVKLLLGTGCRRIVFGEEYPHPEACRRWLAAGREWVQLSIATGARMTSLNVDRIVGDLSKGRERSDFDDLVKRAVEAFAAMPQEEQEAHLRAQRDNWVRGEMELSRFERETTTMVKPRSTMSEGSRNGKIVSEAVPHGRPCDRADCEGWWTQAKRSTADEPTSWLPACAKADCPRASDPAKVTL